MKSYLTYLRFNELILKNGSVPIIVPKCICIVSDHCLIGAHRQFLYMIFKNVILKNNIKSIVALCDNPKYYFSSITMAVQEEIRNNTIGYIEHRIEYYISLFFYNLKIPRHITNFEFKYSDKESCRYQNMDAHNSIFVVKNFDYKLLITRLKPSRIVQIVNAMLLERPIFIIDDDM